MFDMSKLEDVQSVSPELSHIAMFFYKALTMDLTVELRVEDSPHMDIDSILTTKIKEVKIDEDMKHLLIIAPNLHLKFDYETFSQGSSSSMHDKFYFQSENASLTVVVKY